MRFSDHRRSWRAAAVLVAVASVAAGSAVASAGTKTPPATTTPTVQVAASTNLLPADTALADGSTGTGSWVGTGGAVTRVTTPAAASGGTLALTSAAAGYPFLTTGSTAVPATGGAVFTATASVQAATATGLYAPYLVFYSDTGGTLATVKGQVSRDAVGAWSSAAPVVAVAPAGSAYAAMRVLWQAGTGNEIHYLAQPVLTSRRGGSRAVVGPLHTSGNKVYDANGPLVLRGLHRFGFEGSIGGAGVPNNFSRSEVDAAKNWGANIIRLSVASPFWLANDCHYDSTYMSRVDQAVRWITGDGMVALVDLHFNSTTTCSAVGPQLMADAQAVAFWKSAAAHYRSNPLVAFDLYNEPHDISDDVWRNGGQVTSGGTTWKATGMQALYDAVRGTGATNVVVVSGNSWANRFPSNPISGTNLVYGVHAYTCPNSPTGSDCLANPTDPSTLLNSWLVPSATYPVMVSEFGWPAKDDGTYVRNTIDFAELHGWGWSVFAWDGCTCGNFALVADVGPSYEPNATGMPVLQGFGKN